MIKQTYKLRPHEWDTHNRSHDPQPVGAPDSEAAVLGLIMIGLIMMGTQKNYREGLRVLMRSRKEMSCRHEKDV